MKTRKRVFGLLLSLFLMAGLGPTVAASNSFPPGTDMAGEIVDSQSGFDNFKQIRYYNDEFSDVLTSAWYYETVTTAYELGLMVGTGDN